MACEHGENCKGHPNVFDKLMSGREVMSPDTPAQHFHAPAGELIPGDGIFHKGTSWVVKDIRDHDRGRTVVVEPRKGFVGHTSLSMLQFGTPGITTEDTDEQAFTFHPGQVIPRRG